MPDSIQVPHSLPEPLDETSLGGRGTWHAPILTYEAPRFDLDLLWGHVRSPSLMSVVAILALRSSLRGSV